MTDKELIIKYFEDDKEDENPPIKDIKIKKTGKDSSGNPLYKVICEDETGDKFDVEVGIVKNYGVIIVPK